MIAGLCLSMVLCLSGCGTTESSDTSSITDSVLENAKTEADGVFKSTDGNSTKITETSKAFNNISSSSSTQSAETTIKGNAPVQSIKASDFVGTWSEEYSHRAKIEISQLNSETYSINVRWSGSAFNCGMWTMTATFNPDNKSLEYNNAYYLERTYEDEETYSDEDLYQNGTGYFFFEDGKLCWISDESIVDCIDGSCHYTKDSIDDIATETDSK